MDTLAAHLSESLVGELVGAVGLPKNKLTHTIFWRLFRPITDRLANLGAPYDRIINEQGFPAGNAWALTNFCDDLQVQHIERIPQGGPLLVASNHPGTYDSLALFSILEGHDIRCVSSVIPFLELLPHARQYLLFTPKDDVRERMLVFRRAIQHLQGGGAVVFFGSGHRDPDPAVYPGADQTFDRWLKVFDAFFKYVKELRILPMIVSEVISARWAKHPITWFRRKQIDKQRLAEFGQVITQLLKPGRLMMQPRISVGLPFSEGDLRAEVGSGSLHEVVVGRARDTYEESRAYFGDFLP